MLILNKTIVPFQDWITKECFNGNPPTDVDNISSSLQLWAQSMDSICRSVILFTVVDIFHDLSSQCITSSNFN